MRLKAPLSREQAKQGNLIEPGIYAFEVMDASDELSKQKYAIDGTPLPRSEMIKLKLKIYMPDGTERILFDYLTEALEYKMAHFFDCVGLWDKYSTAEVNADDCYGRSGELKVYTQKSKDPMYGDKSSVADYILSEAQEVAKAERKVNQAKQQSKSDFIDDPIPF